MRLDDLDPRRELSREPVKVGSVSGCPSEHDSRWEEKTCNEDDYNDTHV